MSSSDAISNIWTWVIFHIKFAYCIMAATWCLHRMTEHDAVTHQLLQNLFSQKYVYRKSVQTCLSEQVCVKHHVRNMLESVSNDILQNTMHCQHLAKLNIVPHYDYMLDFSNSSCTILNM